MKRKKIPLVARIMIGFAAGTALGLAMSECCAPETTRAALKWIAPFGTVLVAMLKAVVYPIILFSLVSGAASLPIGRSGRVGAAVMLWYAVTSFAATAFGVALAYAANPSVEGVSSVASGHIEAAKAIANGGGAGSVDTFLSGLFQNPFAALADGAFVPGHT